MFSHFCRYSPAALVGLLAAIGLCQSARASTLDVIPARWEGKAVLNVLIVAAGGVSDAAINDVTAAIGDWNDVLPATGAPIMVPFVGKAKDADLLIRIKGGGGVTLGQTSLRTVTPFDCALKQATILLSGKAFGLPFSEEGRLATIRHEIGHVYSLGHSNDPADLMFGSGDPFTTDDIQISDCDLEAVAAVYDAADCAAIPDSYQCD